MEIVRGSIYWMTFEKDQHNKYSITGHRPVIVVANEHQCKHSSSLLVCPITSRKGKYHCLHPRVTCDPELESFVICEQVRSVSIDQLGDLIRVASEREMAGVDRGLRDALGLPEHKHSVELSERDKSAISIGRSVQNIFNRLSINIEDVDTSVLVNQDTEDRSAGNHVECRKFAHKWTPSAMNKFIKYYESHSIDKVEKKYNLSAVTCRKYYNSFSKGKSL